MTADAPACPCGCGDFRTVFTYDRPPAGEVRFPFAAGPYRREVLRCRVCGHFVSRHAMDMRGLYRGGYVDATYGPGGMRAAFERIRALPPERSDNEGRVRRVAAYVRSVLGDRRTPRVLDVGSGLCVFLARLKAEGFAGVALDPDPRAVEHAREAAGVEGVAADFLTAPDMGTFDLICLNKVLEHVLDPRAMLAAALPRLGPGGVAYVELPDGEAAWPDGPEREEFFIDHHHVFSLASAAILAERAGFQTRVLERLREPSGKYTLRAFLARP